MNNNYGFEICKLLLKFINNRITFFTLILRLINIPSLPSNLLPHTISKNGAENVVSLNRSRTVIIRSDRNKSKPPESNNNIESSKPTDPFVYNPFQMDNSSATKHSSMCYSLN